MRRKVKKNNWLQRVTDDMIKDYSIIDGATLVATDEHKESKNTLRTTQTLFGS